MAILLGSDISQWQGTIDWDTYKNNSNFCIIRSTFGNGYLDTQFVRNKNEVRRVGLLHGFYHYCYPQYNTAEAEADWFLNNIDILEGEMLCLDFEESWAGDKVLWCKTFLDHVSSRLNGYKPLIYLNQSLAINNNWQSLVDAGYGLWIAAYTYDPNNNNFQIGNWKFAALQQWTNRQSVPGITGNIDGDVFFGDRNTFLAYGYKPPVQTPVSVPPPVPIPPVVVPTPQACDLCCLKLEKIKQICFGRGFWWTKLNNIKKEFNF